MVLELNLPLIVSSFVANEIFNVYKEKYVKKGLKQLLLPDRTYLDELAKTINNTVDKYEAQYPRSGNFPFYHHKETLAKLSTFILYNDESTNLLKSINFLEVENIDKPTEEQVEHFYNFFVVEIKRNDKLADLHTDENYKSKIFEIYKEVSSVKVIIEDFVGNMPKTDAIIEKWINQIYENLKKLKIVTALDEINQFESDVLPTIQISAKNKAFIYFVKGLCLNENLNPLEALEYFEQASSLDNENSSYKAWFLYLRYLFKHSQQVTLDIREEIKNRPFDPLLNAVVTIEALNLSKIYSSENIPLTTQKNIRYKRIVYKYFLERNLIEQALDFLSVDNTNIDQELAVITIDNNSYLDFYLQLEFISMMRQYPNNLLFQKNEKLRDSSELKVCIAHFEKYLYALKTSEKNKIFSLYEYLYNILLFFRDEDKRQLDQSYAIFQQNREIISPFYFTILKTSFSQIGDYATALKVFEENEPTTDDHYYKSVLHSQNGDEDKKLSCLILYINTLNSIDDNNINMALDAIFAVGNVSENIENFYAKLNSNVIIVNDFYKDILTAARGISDEKLKESLTSIMDSKFIKVRDGLINNEPAIIAYLRLLHFYKFWNGIIVLAEKIANVSMEVERLFIEALWHSKQQSNRLLELLEKWRKSTMPQTESYLIREIRLNQLLGNWDLIKEISLRGEELFPNNLSFKYYLTLSYLALNMETDYCALINKLDILEFSFPNFQTLIQGLITFQKYSLAIDYTYEYAIKYKSSEHRMLFFNVFIFNGGKIEYSVPLLCESGYSLKISNGTTDSLINIVDNKSIFSKFIGKAVGEKVNVINVIGNNSVEYEVKAILHKYDIMISEIQLEAENPELTGIPMQVIKFQDGATGEEMMKQLIDLFGKSGDDRNIYVENKLDNYKDGEISFLQLTRAVFNDDALNAYLAITESPKIGFRVYSHTFFRQFQLADYSDNSFCLDFTSILLFTDLSHHSKFSINRKYLVSQHTLDYFNELLASSINDSENDLSLSITSHGVTPINLTTATQEKVDIINRAIAWINVNCDVSSSSEKLTLINNFPELAFNSNSLVMSYFDTIAIASENDAVLVSDEKLALGMLHSKGRKILSSESYLILCHIELTEENLYEDLSKKNYVGLVVPLFKSKDLCDKMIRNIRDENLLQNLSFQNSGNPNNAVTLITAVKDILKTPTSEDQQKAIVKNLFENFFDGIYNNHSILKLLVDLIMLNLFDLYYSENQKFQIIYSQLVTVLGKNNVKIDELTNEEEDI